MTHQTATPRANVAWRFNTAGTVLYVEEIRKPDARGDRYSYTSKADNALPMTDRQCRDFCAYMRDCDSIGFWSAR